MNKSSTSAPNLKKFSGLSLSKPKLFAFKAIANNLGLLTDKPENFFKFGAEVDDLFIQEKIDARNLARNQKDFVRADEIRDELSDMGVLLDDGPDGTTWKIEKPN